MNTSELSYKYDDSVLLQCLHRIAKVGITKEREIKRKDGMREEEGERKKERKKERERERWKGRGTVHSHLYVANRCMLALRT